MDIFYIYNYNKNINTMIKENKERLDLYLIHLESVFHGQYLRQLTRSELNDLMDIYYEHFGVKYTGNASCSVCVFNMVKLLAKDYFEYVEPKIEYNAEEGGESSKTEYEGDTSKASTKNKRTKKLPN